MSVKKYVVQVMSYDGSVIQEIVCGNSEKYAEKIENETLRKLDTLSHYTQIIERTIDKQV